MVRATVGVAVALVAVAACTPDGDSVHRPGAGGAGTAEEEDTVEGAVRTVAYGEQPDQVADLTLPDGAAPAAGWPVVVLVHGGFWREQYRRDLMAPLAEDLADRGVATWNVEYRRVGGAGGWPTTLIDAAAAVDHLAVVAEDTALDLGRVAVAGHSAGGHLALWLASRAQLPHDAPGAAPALDVCLAVGQAPVADLRAGETLGDGAVRDLLGGDAAEVPDRYAVADPVQLVGHGVPVLLVHGDGDDIVPTEQSQRYADAAAVAGDDVEVVVLPGDHFTVIDPTSELWLVAVDAIDAAC